MRTSAAALIPTEAPAAHGAGAISVVIPLWRDLAALETLLPVLCSAPEVREVIVAAADGELRARVEQLGATFVNAGAPNRGAQLDAGAAVATGRWLLFQHADTELRGEHLRALAMVEAQAVGGAFYRKFDERHPALHWLEPVERSHNRNFGALYGDQSLFARREVFRALGGFRGLPLMEDVDFSRRLRGAGKVVMLDPPIASSPRRHLTRGPWRTTLMNAALLVLFRLGVPPHRLHAWYYRGRATVRDTGPERDFVHPPDGVAAPSSANLIP